MCKSSDRPDPSTRPRSLATDPGVEFDRVTAPRCRIPVRWPWYFLDFMSRSLSASRMVKTTPYPVASVRPRDPPRPTGLPVMNPGKRPPWIFSNSSSIHSMCWALVITSGAGTSRIGPTSLGDRRTHPRQICSCSRVLRLWGSQMTPPFAPPRGMSTTAHFQVIHMDRARTVSTVSCGWKRMPPLPGPRASLCCTRNPRKILRVPSSIRTGMANWYSRSG